MARDFESFMPERIRSLSRDARGYPVPFFVQWYDGKPDFRVMNPESFKAAVSRRLCWTCGKPLMRLCAFVGGPLVPGQRASAEPPSHTECATFAARACPFLAIPTARRRDANQPEHEEMPGIQIEENPGVAAVVVTRSFKLEATGAGPMFVIGEPQEVNWFREGRPATRSEVEEGVAVALARFRRIAPGPRGEARAAEIGARLAATLPVT